MGRRTRKEIAEDMLARYLAEERGLEDRVNAAEARVQNAMLARDALRARLARAREKVAAQRRRVTSLCPR